LETIVMPLKPTMFLSFCNMEAWIARKAYHEGIQ